MEAERISQMEEEEKTRRTEELAAQLLRLARDTILVQLRFLDTALYKLTPVSQNGLGGIMTDGEHLYYDSKWLLKIYKEEPAAVQRAYLHTLLHCIFHHAYGYGKLKADLWDLSADLAVEAVILSLEIPGFALKKDEEAKALLENIGQQAQAQTAEKFYRHFGINPPSNDLTAKLKELFWVDDHRSFQAKEVSEALQVDWKKISERVKTELKAFSQGKTGEETLEKNLAEAGRERYDYAKLLKRFVVMGEDVTPSDEEFDYIYYTYGLEHYGNMPLIEPLEYREHKKVREFVIVLDTSASCRGPLLRRFLNRTYSLLKDEESFFTKINVHILQCDSTVRNDTKITCDEDFTAFLQKGRLSGFGSTDFTPAFTYVNDLLAKGEFENLKGLIYFTDGYGIYPEKMPPYDVIFAFLNEDEGRPPVPAWAIKTVLEEEELEEV